jgi:hypothetical protein
MKSYVWLAWRLTTHAEVAPLYTTTELAATRCPMKPPRLDDMRVMQIRHPRPLLRKIRQPHVRYLGSPDPPKGSSASPGAADPFQSSVGRLLQCSGS